MIFSALLFLFIALPISELALLLQVGEWIGGMETLAIVVVTGVVGATLARWQGLSVIAQFHSDLNSGRMPAPLLLDGLMIIIAGALLVTPGLITDSVGFLLLVPAFRAIVKSRIRRYIESKMQTPSINVTYWES